MSNRDDMTQAMRDAVSMNGGRMTRDEFYDAVIQIRADDGVDVKLDSLKTNCMKKDRLVSAGLTKMQIGPDADGNTHDEIWSVELAQSALDGNMSGGGSNNSLGLTGGADLGTFEADYGTTQEVYYGITRRDADDYPDIVRAQIPTKATGYIEQNGELLKTAIAFTEGMHTMTEGPTGCGKTMAFKEFCYQTGLPLFRVNCKDGMDWEDMVGYMTASKDDDGSVTTQFIDGQLTRAVRYGGLFYADEFNYARPAVLGGLNMVMDSGVLEVAMTGEVIEAHPDFRVVSSFNPGYAGTNDINAATRRRFAMSLVFGYLSADLEAQVIQAQSGVANAGVASELVQFANDVRQMKTQHTVETDLSTASLVSVMTLLKHFNITEALAMAVIPLFDEDERDDITIVAGARLSDYQ